MRTFIQIMAMLLTLESAIFLAKGSLTLSPHAIAELSGTYLDHNPHLLRSLTQQTADYRTGTILLLIAFSLQMGNTLWPMRYKDFVVSGKGALLAIITGVVIMAFAWWGTNVHASHLERNVRGLMEKAETAVPVLQ